MTAQMATRLTLRTFKHKKRKVSIIIAPADKGRAVVVMDIVDYKNKAESLLSDNIAYVKFKSNPTRKKDQVGQDPPVY